MKLQKVGELTGSELYEVRLALSTRYRGPSEAQRLLTREDVVRVVVYVERKAKQ